MIWTPSGKIQNLTRYKLRYNFKRNFRLFIQCICEHSLPTSCLQSCVIINIREASHRLATPGNSSFIS